MRKPNAEVFEHVLKEQQLDPAKTLFIDDSAHHIRAAKSLGINTVHLTEAATILDLDLSKAFYGIEKLRQNGN